jgi:hypothetical protein
MILLSDHLVYQVFLHLYGNMQPYAVLLLNCRFESYDLMLHIIYGFIHVDMFLSASILMKDVPS